MSETGGNGKPRLRERIVFWICLVNGFCSLLFGGVMMAFPVGTPLGLGSLLEYMGDFPFQELFFQDLFWSGLALVACNGVMNVAAVIAYLRRSPHAMKLALAAGLMLEAWCIVECIFFFNFAAVFYLAVGCLQFSLAFMSVFFKRPIG